MSNIKDCLEAEILSISPYNVVQSHRLPDDSVMVTLETSYNESDTPEVPASPKEMRDYSERHMRAILRHMAPRLAEDLTQVEIKTEDLHPENINRGAMSFASIIIPNIRKKPKAEFQDETRKRLIPIFEQAEAAALKEMDKPSLGNGVGGAHAARAQASKDGAKRETP
jgi:hypothetical protein